MAVGGVTELGGARGAGLLSDLGQEQTSGDDCSGSQLLAACICFRLAHSSTPIKKKLRCRRAVGVTI